MTTFPVATIARDPDALEAFYREHVEALQAFVSRRTDDPAVAADLTADIFMAAMDHAESYAASRGTPRAWLYGIARTTLKLEWRREARRSRAMARLGGQRHLEDPDAHQRVVERLDAHREARRLYERVQSLPERLRAVLELVALDGLDVADAAAVLGISAGAARVRLHRARQRVRDDPIDRSQHDPIPAQTT